MNLIVKALPPWIPPFNALVAYDLRSHRRLFLSSLSSKEIDAANDVTVDHRGNAFITNSGGNFIWKVTADRKRQHNPPKTAPPRNSSSRTTCTPFPRSRSMRNSPTTTAAAVVLQQRIHHVRSRPKEREARRKEMVSEKEGWSKTKGRSLEERDGVGEGGVVGDQREKLRGERGVKGVASPAGCGALIRDHQGRWVCGLAYKIGIMSPYIAELWGVCQGLIMARERNVH
ncbi:hypothetical protein JHK82_013869 [Glycine max]|nr:hypothetical protein JHK86_013879 [Glycine max]KAG5155900.1 hypothetical protein JHK82_013869 [Glycine max]